MLCSSCIESHLGVGRPLCPALPSRCCRHSPVRCPSVLAAECSRQGPGGELDVNGEQHPRRASRPSSSPLHSRLPGCHVNRKQAARPEQAVSVGSAHRGGNPRTGHQAPGRCFHPSRLSMQVQLRRIPCFNLSPYIFKLAIKLVPILNHNLKVKKI